MWTANTTRPPVLPASLIPRLIFLPSSPRPLANSALPSEPTIIPCSHRPGSLTQTHHLPRTTPATPNNTDRRLDQPGRVPQATYEPTELDALPNQALRPCKALRPAHRGVFGFSKVAALSRVYR